MTAFASRETSSSIRIRTLTDGGQQALEIAHLVADYLGAAKRSLDLAQYDFHLGPETREVVAGALRDAAARGVAVRIIYNVDHANPIPVPAPPEPDVELISSLGVPSKAIAGVPDLMHHKFVVRYGESVWTGSMNWTDDSWSRQENLIVTVDSDELARVYTLAFEEQTRIMVLMFPCEALSLPVDYVGQLAAVRMGSGGLSGLVGQFIRQLSENLDVLNGPSGSRLATNALDAP